MEGFEIVMDKNLVSTELLLLSEPSLPQAMRMLNQCTSFAGLYRGRAVAVCLLDKKEKFYDIVNLAVDPAHRGKGFGREMITYALDYVRVQGGRYVESGAGNASVAMFLLFQRLGFRLAGVWPDYFQPTGEDREVQNGITNRDLLRYCLDLSDPALRIF